MSEETKTNSSGGVGLTGLLLLLFIGLKLTGHIDWSWWWVLSPIWGAFALVLSVLAIIFMIALVAERRSIRKARKRRRF
jgi:predicted tellurium resistance membrane protein TerC